MSLVKASTATEPPHEALDPVREPRAPGGFVSVAEAIIPFTATVPVVGMVPGLRRDGPFLVRDFGRQVAGVRRILALQFGGFGDFVIALPALRGLRAAFPNAVIRMVCGSWNVDGARACAAVDEVCSFDYRPGQPSGSPLQGWEMFAAAVQGDWDIALDMRVDEDTRHLLGRVNATVRCGIGSAFRFPLLDVALPSRHGQPVDVPSGWSGDEFLAPGRFTSLMPTRNDFFHETGFAKTDFANTGRHIIFGPHVRLPRGEFTATFGLSMTGFVPGLRPLEISVDVFSGGHRFHAQHTIGRAEMAALKQPTLTLPFSNDDEHSTFEFRVHLRGRPLAGKLQFAGVRLHQVDAAPAARFRPAELHVGETLSLLVSLIEQRVGNLYGDAPGVGSSRPGRRVVIALANNGTLRDWPTERYATLVGLLLRRPDCEVVLVGAPGQQAGAAVIATRNASPRLRDMVGETALSELPAVLAGADLVICNNSGIAHQAASLNARTLAIYSGSHQPQEWGPRGARSRAIMAYVECSPCGHEAIEDCPNDHICMKLITPGDVLRHVDECLAVALAPASIKETAP